jgi:hypothetical protein
MNFQVGQFVQTKTTKHFLKPFRAYEIVAFVDSHLTMICLKGQAGSHHVSDFVPFGSDTLGSPAEVGDPNYVKSPAKPLLTLPIDSIERKDYPLMSGCLNYFPAALAGVAKISKIGNDKHNPGEPLHHARSKSRDHGDCIIRHLVDLQDLLANDTRSGLTPTGKDQVLLEVSSLAWRALALSQELHEQFGAPLAPSARP